MTTKKENIYQKTAKENIQDRKFYECPINATHNTLIRHRNVFLESVIKEVNCRVAEIVMSTIKYPVFIEVDMRFNSATSGDDATKCEVNPSACKIGHGFTGSSNLLDFLKIVTTVYEKCYTELGTDESDPKPYPLIIGFDVPSECGKTIYSEINKILEHCQNDMGGALSRDKGSTTDIKMEMQKRLVGLGKDFVFTKKTGVINQKTISSIFKETGGEAGTATSECSEKKLSNIMGKIIFRTKSKELKDELIKNKINYIDYVSSKSIKFGSSGIKYPLFNLEEELKQEKEKSEVGLGSNPNEVINLGKALKEADQQARPAEVKRNKERLLRIYPGISIRGFFFHQKTISSDIITKLNNLFDVGKVLGGEPTPTYIKFDGDEKDPLGKYLESIRLKKPVEASIASNYKNTPETEQPKLEFPKWTGKSSLGPINMISYNYPITKGPEFTQLEDNFYEFYNGKKPTEEPTELSGNKPPKEQTRKEIFNGLKTELKL